jgi:threonine/homoserine/homoserine lactone efflux protein
MQTVLLLPFFADAAMPFWMMGAYFLLIALAITALVMLVILFMRRKRKQKP